MLFVYIYIYIYIYHIYRHILTTHSTSYIREYVTWLVYIYIISTTLTNLYTWYEEPHVGISMLSLQTDRVYRNTFNCDDLLYS